MIPNLTYQISVDFLKAKRKLREAEYKTDLDSDNADKA